MERKELLLGWLFQFPHNLNEVCDAALYLIDNRDKNHNELYNIINGPDFPTGGTVIESKDNIIDI